MRRSVFSLVFALSCLAAFAPARAADSPFVVKDVHVDASAASASEAFNIAVDEGRQKAWTQLIHRLTPQADWAKIPTVDEATLKRMIRGYNVSDEKRSTTRYVADVTYTFNDRLVRSFLQGANIAYTDAAAPPLLLIPLSPGYAPDSPWAAAWAGHRMAAGAVPIDLPAGDALDKSILGAIGFDSASWSDVEPEASRAGVNQVALALATPPAGGQMMVKIRILSPTFPQRLATIDLPVAPAATPAQAYEAAMQAAAGEIGNTWTARNAVDFNRQATLTANVSLESLSKWGAIEQSLAKVPVITNVSVVAMNIGQARLAISYAGTPQQLTDFLSQAGLGLSSRDGVWWLERQSASGGMRHR